jgi:hypothetical protein
MNKQLLIIIFLLSSITTAISAQDKEIQTADRYFNQFNYSKAVKKYLKLIEEGKSTYYATNKIAECYKHLQKPEKAIEWYLKAIKFPDFDYHLYYLLAQELKKVNQYESAQDYTEKYLELSGARLHNYNYPLNNYIRLLKEDSARYEIYNLKINSASSEFGPCIYSDKLIFSSNRPNRTLINRDDIMTNQPFFGLYQAQLNSLYDLSDPKHFAENIKSNLNLGPICFNREQTLMYITKNISKTKKGKVTLDIFISKKSKGKWDKNTERIPMQNSGFTVAHPSLSKNGKRFYFSSDMPGGYGGMDLYVCDNKNGFLSTPENLGPEINTAGNEVFPFVSNDGRLYFASDGLQGLGGLDIFFAIPSDDTFSYPFNLGYPINTSADDFSLILTSDMRTGYLTSNREGGKGKDDIYAFRIIKPLDYCLIVGTVVDETSGEPINGTQVVIKNSKGLVVYKLTTDPNGGFSIYLKGDKNYSFSCRKKLFKRLEGKFTEVQMLNKKILQVELSLQPK